MAVPKVTPMAFYETLCSRYKLSHNVFGENLQALMEEQRKWVPFLEEPWIVRKSCDHINRLGLSCEGIFRVSGAYTIVESLMHAFNNGDNPNFDEANVSPEDVADLLKRYLRELPEPLIADCYLEKAKLPPLNEILNLPTNEIQATFPKVLASLPFSNRAVICDVFHTLALVSENSAENKMMKGTLATIFGSMSEVLSSSLPSRERSILVCTLIDSNNSLIDLEMINDADLEAPLPLSLRAYMDDGTFKRLRFEPQSDRMRDISMRLITWLSLTVDVDASARLEGFVIGSHMSWERVDPDTVITDIPEFRLPNFAIMFTFIEPTKGEIAEEAPAEMLQKEAEEDMTESALSFEATSPVTGVMSPATGVMSPATKVMSPATGAMSPATGAMSPATGAMSPATGAMSPDTLAISSTIGAMSSETEVTSQIIETTPPSTEETSPETNETTSLSPDKTRRGKPRRSESSLSHHRTTRTPPQAHRKTEGDDAHSPPKSSDQTESPSSLTLADSVTRSETSLLSPKYLPQERSRDPPKCCIGMRPGAIATAVDPEQGEQEAPLQTDQPTDSSIDAHDTEPSLERRPVEASPIQVRADSAAAASNPVQTPALSSQPSPRFTTYGECNKTISLQLNNLSRPKPRRSQPDGTASVSMNRPDTTTSPEVAQKPNDDSPQLSSIPSPSLSSQSESPGFVSPQKPHKISPQMPPRSLTPQSLMSPVFGRVTIPPPSTRTTSQFLSVLGTRSARGGGSSFALRGKPTKFGVRTEDRWRDDAPSDEQRAADSIIFDAEADPKLATAIALARALDSERQANGFRARVTTLVTLVRTIGGSDFEDPPREFATVFSSGQVASEPNVGTPWGRRLVADQRANVLLFKYLADRLVPVLPTALIKSRAAYWIAVRDPADNTAVFGPLNLGGRMAAARDLLEGASAEDQEELQGMQELE